MAVDGTEQARAFHAAGQSPTDPPVPHGPGVPRGRVVTRGDGGGAREPSHDGTKPIGGRKSHPGSPPSGGA